jgi:hypothetical protein
MNDTTRPITDELRARFAQPVRGPSYRPAAKWMVVSTLVTLAAYGAQVMSRVGSPSWTILVLIGAGAFVLLSTTWYILNGNTTIDADGVRQDWLFEKNYPWSQVMHARRLRVPFTSRLLVRMGAGPIKAIHSGNAELDAAFTDITAIYARHLRG